MAMDERYNGGNDRDDQNPWADINPYNSPVLPPDTNFPSPDLLPAYPVDVPDTAAAHQEAVPVEPNQPPAVAVLKETFAFYEDRHMHAMEKTAAVADFIDTITAIADILRPALPELTDEDVRALTLYEFRAWFHEYHTDALLHSATLEEAGLRETDSLINPQPYIADSNKLAALLGEAVAPDDTLRSGIENALTLTLDQLRAGYLPYGTSDERGAPAREWQGSIAPDVSPGEEAEFRGKVEGALDHASLLAGPLGALGIRQRLREDFLLAGIAHKEDVLGAFFVVHHWDLLQPATSKPIDTKWTQWGPEDWRGLEGFIENLAVTAPDNSETLRTIAATVSTNISMYRDGILHDPIPQRPLPELLQFREEDILAIEEREPLTEVEQERLRQRRVETLIAMDRVAQRLQQFV